MRHLSEYLAMRPKAREAQRFVVGLGVDQHQIGLDVAIPVARPIAAQIMVAVFGIKRTLGRVRGQAGPKTGIDVRSLPALYSSRVVALDTRPELQPPHREHPS